MQNAKTPLHVIMILIITRRCDDGNKLFPFGAGQHSIVKRGHLSLPRETGQPADLRQRPSRRGEGRVVLMERSVIQQGLLATRTLVHLR